MLLDFPKELFDILIGSLAANLTPRLHSNHNVFIDLFILDLVRVILALDPAQFFDKFQSYHHVWNNHVGGLKWDEGFDYIEQICLTNFFVFVLVQEIEEQVFALLGIDAHELPEGLAVLPEVKALALSEMDVLSHDVTHFFGLLFEFLYNGIIKLCLVHL